MKRPIHHLTNRLLLIGCCSLLGCSAIFNPYRTATKPGPAPDLKKAIEYTEELRTKYHDAVRDFAVMDRTIGVALIGAGATAAGLGITNGSTKAIAGLGIGGAGLYAVDRWLYEKSRLLIYISGERALACAVSAFAPLQYLDVPQLKISLKGLQDKADAVRNMLTARPELELSPEGRHARSALVAADTTLLNGKKAIKDVSVGGARLYATTEKVRSAIDTALVRNEPDLAVLLRDLRQSLSTNAGLIAPSGTGAAPVKQSAKDPTLKPLRDKIAEETRVLEVARAGVEIDLAVVGEAPSDEQLTACVADANTAGRFFRVDPKQVYITTGGTDVTASVVATGGTPPFHARFVGSDPGPNLVVAAVDHDSGGGNQGIAKITAKSGAPTGTFALLVTDEALGAEQVLVSVNTGGGTEPEKPKPPASEPDPAVTELQNLLAERGCLAKSEVDGRWGPNTKAAVEKIGITATEIANLTNKDTGAVDATKLKNVIAATAVTCSNAPATPPTAGPAPPQPPAAPNPPTPPTNGGPAPAPAQPPAKESKKKPAAPTHSSSATSSTSIVLD